MSILDIRRRGRSQIALAHPWIVAIAITLASGCAQDDRQDPAATGQGPDEGSTGEDASATAEGEDELGHGDGPFDEDDLFEGPIESQASPASNFLRLTHRQWANTVEALLRLPGAGQHAHKFIAEPLQGSFDTHADLLVVGNDLWLDYQLAAERLAREVAREPEALRRLFPDPDGAQPQPSDFIKALATRAYRRPPSEAQIEALLALFGRGPELFDDLEPFVAGTELLLSALLQSPHFLYRVESSGEPDKDGIIALDGYEIATRLSYALTHSMPRRRIVFRGRSGPVADPRATARAGRTPPRQQCRSSHGGRLSRPTPRHA